MLYFFRRCHYKHIFRQIFHINYLITFLFTLLDDSLSKTISLTRTSISLIPLFLHSFISVFARQDGKRVKFKLVRASNPRAGKGLRACQFLKRLAARLHRRLPSRVADDSTCRKKSQMLTHLLASFGLTCSYKSGVKIRRNSSISSCFSTSRISMVSHWWFFFV